jgi:hypothetical protein
MKKVEKTFFVAQKNPILSLQFLHSRKAIREEIKTPDKQLFKLSAGSGLLWAQPLKI